jgi:hypothetical protein
VPLDHHHAERLVPADGEQEGRSAGQELELALVGDLAKVDGVRTEQWLHLVGEVLHLPGFAHLGRHQDPEAGPSGHLDRPMATLVVGHPAEEEDVRSLRVTRTVAHRELRRLYPVVDHPGDGHVGCGPVLRMRDGDERHPSRRGAVEVRQVVVEGSVDRRGHGEVRVVDRVERAHDGVVVDDVALPDGLVGVQDMA